MNVNYYDPRPNFARSFKGDMLRPKRVGLFGRVYREGKRTSLILEAIHSK